MFDYINDETEEDDVIVFIKPRVMAMLTSRKSSVYHTPDDDQELFDYFDEISATHLVVVENDDAFLYAEIPSRLVYIRSFVERNKDELTPVFVNNDFSIYRVGSSRQLSQKSS